MANGQRVDPFNNFNFLVEVDGITRAAFQEASGFDSMIDVVEHREGGENTTARKLPGMTKYSNITLKWGTARRYRSLRLAPTMGDRRPGSDSQKRFDSAA